MNACILFKCKCCLCPKDTRKSVDRDDRQESEDWNLYDKQTLGTLAKDYSFYILCLCAKWLRRTLSRTHCKVISLLRAHKENKNARNIMR